MSKKNDKTPETKPRKKSKAKRVIFIVFAAIIALFVYAANSGNKAPEDVATDPTEAPIVEATTEPIAEPEAEQGTTEKVDQIIRQAKADAAAEDAEAKAQAAYDWIVENVPEWYDGPEIMEQAIYNGALVEYYYTDKNDVRAEVGADTVQSVKYVYRGVETVLDDATQENIQQIREGIEKDQG